MPSSHTSDITINYRWALAVTGVALILRIVHLFQFESTVLFDSHIMDMKYHHEWALAVARGQEFVEGPFFRAPLYPMIMGAVYYLAGPTDWAIRILQLVMGTASVWLVYVIAARVFNNLTATIAGMIVAAYGTLIFYEAQLLIPTTIIFLNLLAIYFFIKALETTRLLFFILAGLSLGLSATARPTILLFAAVAGLWLLITVWRRKWRLPIRNVVLYGIAVFIPILPISMYNYAASGEFTLIGTYGGLNAYIGNNLQSDGVSAQLPGARRDWWGMMEDAELIAERDVGHELTPAELSSYWFDRTLDEILDRPLRFVSHLARKTVLLINGFELSNNFDLYFFAHQTSILNILMFSRGISFPWGIVFPLAVFGMIVMPSWDRSRRLLFIFVISYAAAIVLFFVTARYRLPLVPVMAIFAACGLEALTRHRRRVSMKRLSTGLVILVVSLVVANIDFLGYNARSDAQAYFTLANIYGEGGDFTSQEIYYRRSIAADSGLTESYNNLGLMLAARQDFEKALDILEKGVRRNPYDISLQYNYGYVAMKAGRFDLAKQQFRHVLAEVPDYYAAANNLALTHLQAGHTDSAKQTYREAIALTPAFSLGWYGLGQAHLIDRNYDSARVSFDRTLSIEPSFAKAHYGLGLAWIGLERADSAAFHLRQYLATDQPAPDLASHSRQLLDSLGRE